MVQRRSVELRREASEGTIVPVGEPMAVNMGGEIDRLVLGPPVPSRDVRGQARAVCAGAEGARVVRSISSRRSFDRQRAPRRGGVEGQQRTDVADGHAAVLGEEELVERLEGAHRAEMVPHPLAKVGRVATIGVVHVGWHGHVGPANRLTAVLAAAGHRVVAWAPPDFHGQIADAGAEPRSLPWRMPSGNDGSAADPSPSFHRPPRQPDGPVAMAVMHGIHELALRSRATRSRSARS